MALCEFSKLVGGPCSVSTDYHQTWHVFLAGNVMET